jgi:hypothetical protein
MALGRKRARRIAVWLLIIPLLLFFLIIYLRYSDLKKAFIAKISGKTTSVIGQEVCIEDLSISPSGAIDLYDITIKNPKEFGPGQLLQIKKLHLDMRLRQFLKGRFSFRNITLYSPELTLMKNGKGRLNISDALSRFLSEKSTAQYQVDEFRIDSGLFDFNREKRYQSGAIHLHLKNLSSDPGTKTGIKGAVIYAGNKVRIDGWIYFNNAPKKVSLSISSEDFTLSEFRKYLEAYKIDIEKSRITIGLHAEGDTERGFHITSSIQVKRARFYPLTQEMGDLRLRANAKFSFPNYSLVINDASLFVNGVSTVTLRGTITNLNKNPSYFAEIKIHRFDISGLNMIKDLKAHGILAANNLRVIGNFETKVPNISGTLQLRDGGVESHDALIKNIDADVIFSTNREMSVKGEASARLLKVGGYLFGKPVDVTLSTTLEGTQRRMAVASFLTLSPIEMEFKNGESAYLDGSHVMIEGVMERWTFSGRNSFEIMGIRYGHHTISKLKSRSNIDCQKDEVTFRNLKMEAGEVKSSANQVRITVPKKTGYGVEIREMSMAYCGREAELKKCDFDLDLHTGEESISGDLRFSAGTIMFQGMSFRNVSGSVKFDDKNFALDIPQAEFSGGKITLTAQGRTSKGPFPIKTNVVAAGMDLGVISKSTSTLLKLPYRVTGDIKKTSFEGTILSQNFLNGHSFINAGEVSILTQKTGRNIVKDVLLNADIEFKGKDLTLKADAATGNISMQLLGTVKGFMGKDRHVQVKGTLFEAKVTEMRDSFWDIFPDSLLYVGLDGSISSEVSINYTKGQLDVNGNLLLKDCLLKGENNEYSVGPINGTLPIGYGRGRDKNHAMSIPSFEKSQYDTLSKYYTEGTLEDGFHRVTIGSFHYGFPLLDDIRLLIKQNGNVLNIARFNANIFGGRVNGSAMIDLSNGVTYRGGFLIKGLSLSTLCDRVEPIQGFISGKVDGIASFKGSGINMSQLMGMAEFWTYPTRNEKAMISKEFLNKIGGPSLKIYLRNRPFNKGIMALYLGNGYLIFKELEISNTNFLGITDLSVKVAPFNNRIALDHLLWTVTVAAERVRKKQ